MVFFLALRRTNLARQFCRNEMIMTNCRSVCRIRVATGDLTGVSADDLVEYYLGSWAERTLATYKVALGRE